LFTAQRKLKEKNRKKQKIVNWRNKASRNLKERERGVWVQLQSRRREESRLQKEKEKKKKKTPPILLDFVDGDSTTVRAGTPLLVSKKK